MSWIKVILFIVEKILSLWMNNSEKNNELKEERKRAIQDGEKAINNGDVNGITLAYDRLRELRK